MSDLPSITPGNNNDRISDDDDKSDHTSMINPIVSLQLAQPCANECNVVQRNGRYYVEHQNKDSEEKWPVGLKPHEKSDPFVKDKNLIGEVVYGRDGKPVGEIAVKEPEELECHAGTCEPDTQHSRLHFHLYDVCPEEETGLVATGFANKDGAMAFNSSTFNDSSKPYLDKTRYNDIQTREAGEDAQKMIKEFYQ